MYVCACVCVFVMQLAPAAGALVFATWLCGTLLERETEKQGGAYCVGYACFGPTWLIMVGLQGCALAVGVGLWRNTRQGYRQTVAAAAAKRGKQAQGH